MGFKDDRSFSDLILTQNSNSKTNNEIWLRITAFLSLKSENTQRNYISIISEWCEFLGVSPGTTEAATKVKAASELEALAYRKWLETKPGQSPRIFRKNKPSRSKQIAKRKTASAAKDGTQSTLTNSTIRKKIAVLRRIYRLLESCNLSDNGNPFATDKIPPPSALSGQKRPTEMISFEKVMELISLPDDSTPKGLRDKCILAVLFGGGLRRSELVNLRLADLKKTPSGTSFLRLRSTKAKTDADQALPNWAADLIWKLYQSRKSQDAKDGDFLFISYRGKGGLTPTSYKLSDNGLYRLFKNYCSIAGIKEFVSPHSARATAITKLLADGISHRKVQEFSRHASIQMVENYDKRRLTVEDSPAQLLDYKD